MTTEPNDRTASDAAGRAAAAGLRLGVLLTIVAIAVLGAVWWRDRAQRWEPPAWNPAAFVELDARPAGAAHETWAVAFNPTCGHCVESVRHAIELRSKTSVPVRLVALVVDSAQRPSGIGAAALGVDAVWWDREQRWRQRWGHRAYGEILCFDARGEWLRTLPSGADAPR